jgi:hypothetical protein
LGCIFKIKEPNDVEEWSRHDQRLIEIQLLRRRIEKLRNTLCKTRRDSPPRNENLEELRPVVESTPEEKRNAELDDLKAKLLGRKK